MPAASPLTDAEGVLRVTVSCDGTAMPEMALISVDVRREVNKVPSATLSIADGDISTETFPLSSAATFKPGVKLEVKAGYGESEALIFSGIVVRHSLRIKGQNDARLVVECRDEAVKMTIGRKCASYIDQKDSDILSTLIGAYAGLTADVGATTEQHKELMQHYCTDWDYLLSRAEANGQLVVVTDGTVAVKAPVTSGDAVLSVKYGQDLIEFDGDLDARHQYSSVQAIGWDPATQALLQSTAEQPAALNAQGNIDSATLSQVLGLASLTLQTGAPVTKAVLDGWAKAQQLKSGLNRLRGRMRFQGSAAAVVGGLIELAGVGDRFNGTVLVTALTHHLEDGDWYTDAEYGQPIAWFTERSDIVSPPAAGLVPGIQGLRAGTVTKLDGDPGSAERIQVSVHNQAETETVWARLMQFYASNGFGAFFVPEIGDEVVLGWFDNDPSFPVVLGSLYSSKNKPDNALTAENNLKAILTRSKLKLEFDEDKKVITLLTPGKNTIVISDDAKSIVLTDQTKNKVELAEGGITLDSPKDIKITAKGTITIDATGALTMTSKADVKVEGLNVGCTAKVGFTAKGSATAELSASGQTTVKGAMVMIN